jgi:stage V sporulation protein B
MTTAAAEKKQDGEESAKRAGRGGVAILAAKAYFIVTGFAQQPLLPLAIGLSGYGALSRVLAIANVLNNVVVSACTQGMSRAVAQSRGDERATLRRYFPAHAVVALAAALLLCALCPLFAWFESAPYIKTPLFVMAGVLGLYGVYAPLIGYLNGRGQFVKQAALDMTAATLRTALLVGVGFFFARRGLGGALGATVGAVIAAALVFAVAVVWARAGQSPSGAAPPTPPSLAPSASQPDARTPTPTSSYLLRLLPIALSQLFTNALMQSDLTLVGRFLSVRAHLECGPVAHDVLAACMEAADKSANEWVAVYRACQLFAFLPYQLLFSVTQVLFPMLAKAATAGDRDELARLTSRGARLSAIVLGLPICVIVMFPGSCISFAYGADVATRGEATLRVLALGQAAFAVMSLGTTILVSLGKEVQAMALVLVAVLLVGGACFLAVPSDGSGGLLLLSTASAASGALLVAMVCAFVLVVRAAGAFIPRPTTLRIGAVVAAAWLCGHVTPHLGRLLLVPGAVAVAVAYFALLVLTRELGAEDAAWLMAIAGKKRGAK